MAFSFTLKFWFLVSTLISIAVFCCKSELAEDDPVETIEALLCFSNEYIYSRCEEAYRLNEKGNINVPLKETDEYCNGPCQGETQLLLNCIDEVSSNFLFYNKATIQEIRNALSIGCGYTSERGNFNIVEQFQGEASYAYKVPCQIYSIVIVSMIIAFGFLFS